MSSSDATPNWAGGRVMVYIDGKRDACSSQRVVVRVLVVTWRGSIEEKLTLFVITAHRNNFFFLHDSR